MPFIKLTKIQTNVDDSGCYTKPFACPVCVNSEKITILEQLRGGTIINFSENGFIQVSENAEEILQKIQEAKNE